MKCVVESLPTVLAGLCLVALCCLDTLVTCDVIPSKNFTRSRYSHRSRTSGETSSESFTTVVSTGKVAEDNPSVRSPLELALLGISNHNNTNSEVVILDESAFVEPVFRPTTCGEKIGENHPWIVVLEHSDPRGKSRKKTLSKGVLIDDRHVLTTVSSIYNSHPFWRVTKARLGDSPTWGAGLAHNRSEIVFADVSAIYTHKTKDIAIVRLTQSVPRSHIISPICLPPNDDYRTFRNPELHRCVRPTTHSMARLPRVTSTLAQLMTQNDCRTMYQRKGAVLTEEELCAWDELGDTCTGDLGGPLAAKINGRHHVIGLNSFLNIESDDFVSTDFPGVYTRVGSHLKWIKSVLKQSE